MQESVRRPLLSQPSPQPSSSSFPAGRREPGRPAVRVPGAEQHPRPGARAGGRDAVPDRPRPQAGRGRWRELERSSSAPRAQGRRRHRLRLQPHGLRATGRRATSRTLRLHVGNRRLALGREPGLGRGRGAPRAGSSRRGSTRRRTARRCSPGRSTTRPRAAPQSAAGAAPRPRSGCSSSAAAAADPSLAPRRVTDRPSWVLNTSFSCRRNARAPMRPSRPPRARR